MGYDSYLHVCLTETCSIYRLGITRLGVCHVIDGLLTVLTGAGLMWLNQGTIWSGIGVWTGLPVMVTGVVCLFSRQKKSRGKISAVTLVCLLAMSVSGFLFTASAYNISKAVVYNQNITEVFPRYQFPDNKAPLLACNSLLVVFGLLEFIISVWSAALSIGMVCICCQMGRDRVFTIPYEGMENDGPHGPDIVASHTRTAINRPAAQLPNNNNSSAFMEELDDTGLPQFPPPQLTSRSGGQAKNSGTAAPPVLQIDMDLEWDEMTVAMEGDEMNTADFVNTPSAGSNQIGGGRW